MNWATKCLARQRSAADALFVRSEKASLEDWEVSGSRVQIARAQHFGIHAQVDESERYSTCDPLSCTRWPPCGLALWMAAVVLWPVGCQMAAFSASRLPKARRIDSWVQSSAIACPVAASVGAVRQLLVCSRCTGVIAGYLSGRDTGALCGAERLFGLAHSLRTGVDRRHGPQLAGGLVRLFSKSHGTPNASSQAPAADWAVTSSSPAASYC